MLARALIFISLVLGGTPLGAGELRVFAAASLSDALREIAPAYQAASGDTLLFHLGGSNSLARQIKEGAPADVFFSADEAKMDELEKAGLTIPDTRRALLSNSLVIVVSADRGAAVTRPADLTEPWVGRLALAEPNTVPAGIYARQWLEAAGLWERVLDKVVPTDNVRACLAAVEAGNADAGIVYKTDALISKKVSIAYEVAAGEGPKIIYPISVVKDTPNREAAGRLAAYLGSPAAAAVFVRYGFLIAPPAEK